MTAVMEPHEQPQLRPIALREIKSEELRGEEFYSNPAGGRKADRSTCQRSPK